MLLLGLMNIRTHTYSVPCTFVATQLLSTLSFVHTHLLILLYIGTHADTLCPIHSYPHSYSFPCIVVPTQLLSPLYIGTHTVTQYPVDSLTIHSHIYVHAVCVAQLPIYIHTCSLRNLVTNPPHRSLCYSLTASLSK
jgi:hypothetical protein